jgi:hypothetical protein
LKVRDRRPAVPDEQLILRLCGLQRSDARGLAETIGADASIVSDELPPIGGYGDLGTETVAVTVTARALREIARYLAARQNWHGEAVSLVVEIDDPGEARRRETLTYKAAPGQSAVEAIAAALRALPGISEALDRSIW